MKGYKYYIINENKKIIDHSDNTLEFRMTCAAMDARVGDKDVL